MITFFITVALLFFFILSPSMIANAQAMPSISESTFSVIEGGQTDLTTGHLLDYGLISFLEDDFRWGLETLLGSDVYLNPSDFTVRQLTEIEKENIESGFTRHFYDYDGHEIPISDLYYVQGNNGYLQTEFYMDSDGNVLYGDLNHSNYLMNFGFADEKLGLPDSNYANWDAVYSDIADRIVRGNFNFYPDEIPDTDNSYFVWVGETAGGRPAKAGYILIPNQYIPGTIVPINDSGSIYRWYTRDPSLIQSVTTLGNFQPTTVSQGNYSYNGYSYPYLVTGIRGTLSMGTPINYDDWIDGTDRSSRIFGRQGVNYSELNTSAYSTPYKRAIPPEVPLIDVDELYSYDELTTIQPEAAPETNPNFDPTSPIEPDNYPVSFPVPVGFITPSDLPLPGSNNQINPAPGIENNPLVNIDPNSPLPFNVPIISDLQYRFPFSIPWDLWRMLRHTVFEPVAPAWDFDWSITVLGHTYTTHFQGDLSAFDSLAEIFRTLLLVSFVLFLAFVSYKFFF